MSLPSAQKVPVTLALNNTLFLIRETEYMPWQAALSSLSYFKLMFDRSEVYGPMKVQGGRAGFGAQFPRCQKCTIRELLEILSGAVAPFGPTGHRVLF